VGVVVVDVGVVVVGVVVVGVVVGGVVGTEVGPGLGAGVGTGVGSGVGVGVGFETCGVTWRVTGFGLTAGTLVWTTISWELGVDTWTGVCTTAVAWEASG